MKKFILLHVGFEKPTKEIVDAWMKWFADIKDHVADSGNPFGQGREVTPTETRELPRDRNSLAGYTIVNAKDMNAAVDLVKSCPMITSMRVYEAMTM